MTFNADLLWFETFNRKPKQKSQIRHSPRRGRRHQKAHDFCVRSGPFETEEGAGPGDGCVATWSPPGFPQFFTLTDLTGVIKNDQPKQQLCWKSIKITIHLYKHRLICRVSGPLTNESLGFAHLQLGSNASFSGL